MPGGTWKLLENGRRSATWEPPRCGKPTPRSHLTPLPSGPAPAEVVAFSSSEQVLVTPDGDSVSGRLDGVDAVGRPVVLPGGFAGPVAEMKYLAGKRAHALDRARTKTRQVLVTGMRQRLLGEPVWPAVTDIRAEIPSEMLAELDRRASDAAEAAREAGLAYVRQADAGGVRPETQPDQERYDRDLRAQVEDLLRQVGEGAVDPAFTQVVNDAAESAVGRMLQELHGPIDGLADAQIARELAEKRAAALFHAKSKTRQILVSSTRRILLGEPVWPAVAEARAEVAATDSSVLELLDRRAPEAAQAARAAGLAFLIGTRPDREPETVIDDLLRQAGEGAGDGAFRQAVNDAAEDAVNRILDESRSQISGLAAGLMVRDLTDWPSDLPRPDHRSLPGISEVLSGRGRPRWRSRSGVTGPGLGSATGLTRSGMRRSGSCWPGRTVPCTRRWRGSRPRATPAWPGNSVTGGCSPR